MPNYISNFWAKGNVKDASFINIAQSKAILIARNNSELSLLKINTN